MRNYLNRRKASLRWEMLGNLETQKTLDILFWNYFNPFLTILTIMCCQILMTVPRFCGGLTRPVQYPHPPSYVIHREIARSRLDKRNIMHSAGYQLSQFDFLWQRIATLVSSINRMKSIIIVFRVLRRIM